MNLRTNAPTRTDSSIRELPPNRVQRACGLFRLRVKRRISNVTLDDSGYSDEQLTLGVRLL